MGERDYHLFATGMTMPLDADIEVRTSEPDLPSADLNGLYDADMDDVDRPAVQAVAVASMLQSS